MGASAGDFWAQSDGAPREGRGDDPYFIEDLHDRATANHRRQVRVLIVLTTVLAAAVIRVWF